MELVSTLETSVPLVDPRNSNVGDDTLRGKLHGKLVAMGKYDFPFPTYDIASSRAVHRACNLWSYMCLHSEILFMGFYGGIAIITRSSRQEQVH